MGDVYREAAGRLRRFGTHTAGKSTFSYPSLVSPHTPTLANPVRSFVATTESTNQQQAQFADERLTSPAIEQQSFNYDFSRIPLHSLQAKLTQGEPNDEYEHQAERMANQVMGMVAPSKLNAPILQRQLTPQQLGFPDIQLPTATAELGATETPSASNPQLVSLAKDFQNLLAANPQAYIEISGYLSGEFQYNSQKENQNRRQILQRFNAVKAALTSLGVPGEQIEIQTSPPFSDKQGGVIEVRSYKKRASLPSLSPIVVPPSPLSGTTPKPSTGGGLNVPDFSKYTKFSVKLFGDAQLNFDLPSSVAATLPFKAGGGKHVVIDFKAETSKVFSLSIKVQGLSQVELGASASLDISGEQPKGKFEVGATATKQVCSADNAESLKSQMQAKAKELVEGVDALNKASKAEDGSLKIDQDVLEKAGKVGGQLKDIYDLREKAIASCKPVPVGSLKIVGEAEKSDPTKPPEKPDLTKPAPLGNTIMLIFELKL